MAIGSIFEVRLEAYSDLDLDPTIVHGITAILEARWPEAWDIKIPPSASRAHPAEWHAIVPLPEGSTPESLHGQIEGQVRAIDPGHTLRYRTRWAYQQTPDHQEVYEVRWEEDSR